MGFFVNFVGGIPSPQTLKIPDFFIFMDHKSAFIIGNGRVVEC